MMETCPQTKSANVFLNFCAAHLPVKARYRDEIHVFLNLDIHETPMVDTNVTSSKFHLGRI